MHKNTLLVTDIFRSLQGEGTKLGTPSIFLRLAMCNLHCRWCDTPYTWKKGEIEFKEMAIEKVIQKILSLKRRKKISNLVITGGEPLLQQKNILPLLLDSRLADMDIEFETNGSQKLLPELKIFFDRISFNISPKLADSGNKAYKIYSYPNSILKFVYVTKESEKLIDDFLKKNKKALGSTPVFIMPEGTSVKAMSEKYDDAIAYCLKNNFRLTPRLHIYLFGNKRGT